MSNNNKKRIGEYEYMTRDLIGTGSFATVYRGNTVEKKQGIVAIKVIPKSRIQTQQHITALQNELKLMKRNDLDKTHMVQLFSHAKSKNNHYLVMEYMQGKTLTKYIPSMALEHVEKFAYHLSMFLLLLLLVIRSSWISHLGKCQYCASRCQT